MINVFVLLYLFILYFFFIYSIHYIYVCCKYSLVQPVQTITNALHVHVVGRRFVIQFFLFEIWEWGGVGWGSGG